MELKKQHAKDYLLEYIIEKDITNWLRLLIQKAVDSSGEVSTEEKEQIFEELLKENGIESEKQASQSLDKEEVALQKQEIEEPRSANPKPILRTLQRITHIKGVNALVSNQPIKFSSSCTIFFGLNGAGKSGYFRIIHELAGGSKTKNILDNIHKKSDGLEVDVDFSLDSGAQRTFKWQDKNKRGIVPFNQIKVFDSGYLPFFLDKHESSVNIEPLGLNLFQTITAVIDEFKERLEQIRRQKIDQQPDLQILIGTIHSNELKSILQKSSLTEEESQLIEDHKAFSSEEITKLAQLRENKTLLEKNNTEDCKKVLNQEINEINELNEHLSDLKTSLKLLANDGSAAISDYLEKKKTRDERVKQFEILKQVPSQTTEEWQSFIESANIYGTNIDQKKFNKSEKCIYCHQSLGGEAIKLVQAYSQYLEDQSQQDFNHAIDKIEKLKISVDSISTGFVFSADLNKHLSEIENDKNETYKILTDRVLEEANKQKTALAKAMEEKKGIKSEFSLDLLNVDNRLIESLKQRQSSLEALQETSAEKAQKITGLDLEIYACEDNQNISKWKTKIENYFSSCEVIKKYSDINQLINTNGITMLGSRAHNDLLTESIRGSFEDEMKALGKDIEVTLEPSGAGKGAVFTKLKILGNDVNNILSEGEQKAVGLALFLAETENQDDHCPVVFDDPVTSLDHAVAGLLAQKLLKMSSDRQIIIFTHNKLFYDSFVDWCRSLKDDKDKSTHHICKNYGNGNECKKESGHHVYTYRVDRENKSRTGVIFEHENESCNYYIEKAEKELAGKYILSSVAGYLKSAIEYYVDEKVLNKQSLVKEHKKGGHIDWKELKKIKPDIQIIEKLHGYWENLSNRGTHLTANSQENPLSLQELIEIKDYIKLNL